jgi:6-phosphofructokinase 1
MKKIGIVTSGGDAPGMNAAIRAVVRLAHSEDLKIVGFERGYEGLITNTFRPMGPRSVSGIVHRGGTILYTARCPDFKKKEGKQKAAENLRKDKIDGLVVIGGNGSFQGAYELSQISDTVIIGVPSTIDNDVFGTEETIGFDTAVNTAMEQIDKIRDTAVSHERIFVIEVMGRSRGFIALAVGLAVGAEIILVPEIKYDMNKIYDLLEENRKKGKKSSLIVAAEGIGNTHELTKQISEHTGYEARLSVIGYVQRGGNPTARSRFLASVFGSKAVELFLNGERNKIVALQNGKTITVSLEESCKAIKPLDEKILQIAKELAI